MLNMHRSEPNILITGTPGVGKSMMSSMLSQRTGLEWLDVSKIAIENECLEEYDEEYQCSVLDERKLLNSMKGPMSEGGKIVDYHSADFFPERWIDIVFVLRTDNTILYDRLKDRGYCGKKLEDNIDCEIFQIILEEAREYYREEIVHELTNDTPDQMMDNVNRICQWLEQWKIDNQQT
ncbi:adenylate kinase isoenzyme 6 [Temnothorax nylanderi]|uniref:adenylate kinase isoenzyme 6 n=1 Tax=Temnothorax nylanderi TaxID=102681 RepID=UPI003A856EF2